MGCITSKLVAAAAAQRQERELLCGGGGCPSPNHVVSLTSSTYGVIRLDRDSGGGGRESSAGPPPPPGTRRLPEKKVSAEETEAINAWELMVDIDDDDVPPRSPAPKKKPRESDPLLALSRGAKSNSSVPAMAAPGKRKPAGKENLRREQPVVTEIDPSRVLRPFSSSENAQKAAGTAGNPKIRWTQKDPNGGIFPLFDPELVAAFEREHREEGKQRMLTTTAPPGEWKPMDGGGGGALLESFPRNCPPGGDNAAVLYTTTLRGIRKTFDDCNAVRSAIESHGAQVTERDISMDAGFKEELRTLTGRREVRVPVLFVEGRLLGGVEQVLRLEEEGKLAGLLAGIPRAQGWCDGCGGVRFVLCMECSGSCKVLEEEEEKMVRCGECNENGLIRCPICC